MSSLIFRRTCTRVALRFYCALPYICAPGWCVECRCWICVCFTQGYCVVVCSPSLSLVVSCRLVSYARAERHSGALCGHPFAKCFPSMLFIFRHRQLRCKRRQEESTEQMQSRTLRSCRLALLLLFSSYCFHALFIYVCVLLCACVSTP